MKGRAEKAKSNLTRGIQIMKTAKPVKKGKTLGTAKKLEKKAPLTRGLGAITPLNRF